MGLVSDHELVAAVRRGEDRAFETLYQRYQRRIAAYVYGMVNDYGRAEDITQEVFISALRRMRETERPIAFKPWIYEIAKNACIDQFRRSKRAEEISFDADEGIGAAETARLATSGPSPDAAVDAKQQLNTLCGAFGGLSETHHQILVLRELEGLSYREIGERMGLSRPSVESTLFRARRRLTEEYDELVSGQRCVRIQTIITDASTGLLGARDQRRLARHVAHCQPCRREARLAGVVAGDIARRPLRETVAAKVAALFPFPFLRKGGEATSVASGSASNAAVQFTATIAHVGEPLVAGWSKAAAAAATLLVAGLGAGAATTVSSQPIQSSANEGGAIERGAAKPRTSAAPKPASSAPKSSSPTRKSSDSSSAKPTAAEELSAGLDDAVAGTGATAPGVGTAPADSAPGIPVNPTNPTGGSGSQENGRDTPDGDGVLPGDLPVGGVQPPADLGSEVTNAAKSVNGEAGAAVGEAVDQAESALGIGE